jgi:glyoxylate reductase
MARVFVTRQIPGDALERLAAEHDVEVWPGDMPPPREDLLAGVAEAEGLLSMLVDKVDGELLEAAPNLRAVANYAIGFDNIDLEATAARDVQVGNTPDVLTDATADLAWALMLAVARRIVEAGQDARDGRWRTWEPQGWIGADVHGATLAVVGAGRIGRAVAQRASGFEMDVVMVDLGDDLHAALRRADFVSLHTPLTPDTRHLIDAGALAVMKPTAILVNTARGPIVDKVALAAALHDGRLGAAALDVTDPEPLPADDPLLAAPNLLVVPHIASATKTARAAMADRAVDNLLAALDGRPMPYPASVEPPATG